MFQDDAKQMNRKLSNHLDDNLAATSSCFNTHQTRKPRKAALVTRVAMKATQDITTRLMAVPISSYSVIIVTLSPGRLCGVESEALKINFRECRLRHIAGT